jgi:hypothetical protein
MTAADQAFTILESLPGGRDARAAGEGYGLGPGRGANARDGAVLILCSPPPLPLIPSPRLGRQSIRVSYDNLGKISSVIPNTISSSWRFMVCAFPTTRHFKGGGVLDPQRMPRSWRTVLRPSPDPSNTLVDSCRDRPTQQHGTRRPSHTLVMKRGTPATIASTASTSPLWEKLTFRRGPSARRTGSARRPAPSSQILGVFISAPIGPWPRIGSQSRSSGRRSWM